MTWSGETRSRATTSPHRRSGGFTLIEVTIVIAILGLALALIVGYKPPWSSGLGVRAAAERFAAALRLARSEAVAGNAPVSVSIDVAAHRYRIGPQIVGQLPSALAVELRTVAGERPTATEGAIRFNPDGSSTGGRVTLGNGARTIAVGVDWLTGRVSIGDVR